MNGNLIVENFGLLATEIVQLKEYSLSFIELLKLPSQSLILSEGEKHTLPQPRTKL